MIEFSVEGGRCVRGWKNDITGGEHEMLGAEIYPITLAEMSGYQEDADRLFENEEHDRLKEFLAFNPECGDIIAGTGGVRQLLWPISAKEGSEAQIIYFFRDLNMPLYLLAVSPKGEWIDFDDEFRHQVERLVGQLVEEHSKRWGHAIMMRRPDILA